jgi:twinfilin-like protein
MSHSSGIPVNAKLQQSFGEARTSNSKRLIKVYIENDEMIEVGSKPIQGSWEDDLSYMKDLLDAEKACYILYRIEEDWVLFCYVPDKCKVKEKMLYASSRSNLRQQLGSNYFKDEIFGTVLSDFSKEGYQQHVHSKKAEAPLTEREAQKKNELESGEIYTGGNTKYIHGVTFPIDNSVTQATKDLLAGKFNYAQISIDIENEKIIVDHTGNVTLDQLKKTKISGSEPRFHFFRYAHNYEGASVTSNVFIYSCPDGSGGTKPAPVRMRMLYSSSKANVGDILTNQGGQIHARLEPSSPDEISEEELLESLHPKKEEKNKGFSKPSRPGKGGARLIRDTQKQS